MPKAFQIGRGTKIFVGLADAANPDVAPAAMVELKGRTSADLNRTGNSINSFSFENEGYSDNLVATITNEITANGNYLPTDEGYQLCEEAFNDFLEVYVRLELAPFSEAYTAGQIYQCRGVVTGMPLTVPSDNIVTGNITIALSGRPAITPPVAA